MLYHVNTPRVTHEAIDGEIIIIDLVTGAYFSLRDTAAEVWAHVADDGTTEEALTQAFALRYEAAEDEIGSTLGDFLLQLEQEQLVVASPNGDGAEPRPIAPAGERRPFTPPLLEKYTDMQDIILLDPVHNVGEAGWPKAAPAAGG